ERTAALQKGLDRAVHRDDRDAEVAVIDHVESAVGPLRDLTTGETRAVGGTAVGALPPRAPSPATVSMIRSRVTRRMTRFPQSTMKTSPSGPAASCSGVDNCASFAGPPSPLYPPEDLPATGVRLTLSNLPKSTRRTC